MWTKMIPIFLVIFVLAGCGNGNNGAAGDAGLRLSPEVRQEINEESQPGIRDDSGYDWFEYNDDVNRDNNNKEMNDGGTNPNIERNIDGTIESPDMDGEINETQNENGLDNNR